MPEKPTTTARAPRQQTKKVAPSSEQAAQFTVADALNVQDAAGLKDAISALGRVQPGSEEVNAKTRRIAIMRAAQLGLSKQIPGNWDSDGSLKP